MSDEQNESPCLQTEWVWFNGEIVPMADARVGIEDRGFQFADGVYEVIRLYAGVPFALADHLDRLQRSAAGIELSVPMSAAALGEQIARLLRHAGYTSKSGSGCDGSLYLQLTRGVSRRLHAFTPAMKPTLLFHARPLPPVPRVEQSEGVKLLSVEDERWKRCWVKSIALLPNVLAKSKAIEAGADEAVFVENGIVTECSTSNLFGVFGRDLATHPVGPKVLPGITRHRLLALAERVGLRPVERPLTQAEAMSADELFITSTTRELNWVSEWNGKAVRAKACGPYAAKLHAALREQIEAETGT